MNSAPKIFLIRHGEAEQNVVHILSSASNSAGHGLTDRGRNQVRLVADSLRTESVEALFASPLRRTVETAGIIATAIGIPYTTDERLRETDFGRYTGGRVETFRHAYPALTDRVDADGSDGVESFRSIRERAADFWRETSATCAGKSIAIVSHGDTLQVLHGVILGWSLEDALTGWSPRLGEVKEIEW